MTIETMFRPLADDEVYPHQMAVAEPWCPLTPVPPDAPTLGNSTIMKWAKAGYALTSGWRYFDATGALLGFVVRFDRSADGADKDIVPITFCVEPGGRREWRKKSWDAPRPLYGLDRLAKQPKAPVLVVEGEKAADAARSLFPDHVVVTSPGGSNAAGKSDWSPLKARTVIVWPDNDEPGRKYAEAVAKLVSDTGATSVAIVELPASFPPKWDLADVIPEQMNVQTLIDLLSNAGTVDGWPAPLPIRNSLPPVEPLLPEMLPHSLQAYVYDVADRQQSVPDFVAVAALCGIAAIVGNRIRIAPKQNDDWEVVPNLWGAIIGPPSAMKTPAMQSALAPVYALQDEMRTRWQASIDEAGLERMLNGLDAREARKQAAKALKHGDRDAARTLIKDASTDEDEQDPCPRLLVNDATVEKLGELLNENTRGLLLVRDELPGFLARMESEEFAPDRAFYLECYNGSGRFTYDRIGRGTIHIANCTLSLIGGVQPSRIAPIVRGALSGATNDGLLQRLQLAVWPDSRTGWDWIDRPPDRRAREAYDAVFRDLHHLQLGSPEQPAVLRFSSSAQDMFRQWMLEVHSEARSGQLSPVLESHLLKMPKTVASLALLFELIDGGRFEVGEQATLQALAWADYLRTHANRFYAAGTSIAEDNARLILERRHMLPEAFTARDIYRKDWTGIADRDAATAAIEMLVETCHCRLIQRSSSQTAGGRPSESYRWNPALGEP